MDSGRLRTLSRRAVVVAALSGVSAAVTAASRGSGVPAGPALDAGSISAGRGGRAIGAPAARGRAVSVTVPPQLPRGGRRLFPDYRLVGFSGGPGSPAFGRLGIGDIDARIREIETLAAQYAHGRRPLPVLELIAVIAQPSPGDDGRYRVRVGADVLGAYLAAARRHRALLVLNIQPGRARFLDEVVALEPWLRQPDVGLALDPEWAVGPGEVPGRVFGHATGAEIDTVARYLSGLVTTAQLPDKPLVVDQLAPEVFSGQWQVRSHPGVSVIKSVDGIGTPNAKISTWRALVTDLPAAIHPGFKLFFGEDTAAGGRIMTPAEVLALRPTPDYVLYE